MKYFTPEQLKHEIRPFYCTHCASSTRDRLMGKPWTGIWDGSARKGPEDPCIFYVYKKGAKREMDPKILAQVGLLTVEPLKKQYQG